MDYKSILLKQDKKVFKTDDLAVLWNITNRNTLRTTVKRYLKDKILYSLRRGAYSVVPLKKLNPFLLGTAYLKGFSYVSLQSVLAMDGLISQSLASITLVAGRSQRFSLAGHSFLAKKMDAKYRLNLEGIKMDGNCPMATTERAITDILYYNANFHFDAEIDKYRKRVGEIKKKVYDESS